MAWRCIFRTAVELGLLDVFQRRTDKQKIGAAGEDQALRHLQQHGLTLAERNFRCKGGEIDLVMQEGSTLVFVEVRKRKESAQAAQFGGAAASVPSSCRVPSSIMLPAVSTAPGVTCAIAASALVVPALSGSQPVSVPTGEVPGPSPYGVQLLSINPGCTIMSPTLAWSLRASTWLLLSR